jgi:DNA-binding MarR family transcriptional regulator
MTNNHEFDDILTELMIEEETPSYEALVRWQTRYPRFRDELAQYFATWAVQDARARGPQPEPNKIDEEKIVQKGVDYALELLRKQGRILPDEPIPELKQFELLVLTAVYLLPGQNNAGNVTERVGQMSGTQARLGHILVALDRLEAKHLISSYEREEDDGPGKYFRVTLPGERALAHAKETETVVARFLPDLA